MDLTNTATGTGLNSPLAAWGYQKAPASVLEPHLELILKAAIQAPSGYNSQPWKFAVTGNDITVLPDFSRSRPVVDPMNRELFFSLGAVAENIRIAASHAGYGVMARTLEEGGLVSGLRLSLIPEQGGHSRLTLRALKARRTTRTLFSGETIVASRLAELKALQPGAGIQITIVPAGKEALQYRDLYLKAHTEQLQDPGFLDEFLQWSRFGSKNAERAADGLAPDSVRVPRLRAGMGRKYVKQFITAEQQATRDIAALESASHIALISAKADDRPHWISAGETAERFQILAAQLGILSSYHNAPCQVDTTRREMDALFGLGGFSPVAILRLGYGTAASAPERRLLREFLKA